MEFARGGIVDTPEAFAFARGLGIMGEAGPEAILPLAIHAAQHERAGHDRSNDATGSTTGLHLDGSSQRLRPSYTVSPAGQRHFHHKPLAGRAPNRPLWGDVRFAPDFVGCTPRCGRGTHPRRTSQFDPKEKSAVSEEAEHWPLTSPRYFI